MNNELFQQAKTAAAAKDYQGALRLYTQCLKDEENPLKQGEVGLVYHQVGNCLMKLKAYNEAIQAYNRAASDTAYDACGAVNCNAGMAYAALRDYDNAVKHFEIAVSDSKYPTRYKAYSNMGSALLKQGKSAEAGVAFREAALDEANPDPTKALLNLGVCFMALNRPADAVSSYESALQFASNDEIRNKLYASLGQAYVACGKMQQAVDAFERAIADKTYFLSASASVDYQRAIAAVSQGVADRTQVLPPLAADVSGIDVVANPEGVYRNQDTYGEEPAADETEVLDSSYYFADAYDGAHSEGADDRFFNATDEELEQWSKGVVKEERKRRGVGLKILLAIIIVIVVLLGAGVVLYAQGYGYPTQETVVEELFSNPESTDVYADTLSDSDIEAIQAIVPAGSTATVDGIDRSASSSVVYVTATLPKGSEMQYAVTMTRDNIGWKVSSVSLYFTSQN